MWKNVYFVRYRVDKLFLESKSSMRIIEFREIVDNITNIIEMRKNEFKNPRILRCCGKMFIIFVIVLINFSSKVRFSMRIIKFREIVDNITNIIEI